MRRPFDLLARYFEKRLPLGPRGEAVAARHLRGLGYRIVGRNLRSRIGEIDLLAETPDRTTIVVVEVKAGRAGNPRPEVHVNAAKQRKLTALGHELLKRHRLQERRLRFDVVAVEFGEGGEPAVRHHVGAFQGGW